jgi:protein-S-isoprenylcysteine O-methyltransferase Ste14
VPVVPSRPSAGLATAPRPRAADWRDLLLGRVVPALLFAFVLVAEATRLWNTAVVAARRGASLADTLAALDNLLVLAYYCLLVFLYVVRLPPRGSDRRPLVAAASFAGSFMVMLVPFLPGAPRRDWLLVPADLLGLAGIVFTVWSLLYLRRSFSILPQARRLVTGGPYSVTRNPLYIGEMVSSWAVFLPTIAVAGVLVLLTNVALQVVRVLAEERVLGAAFGDDYEAYRRRVPRFFWR